MNNYLYSELLIINDRIKKIKKPHDTNRTLNFIHLIHNVSLILTTKNPQAHIINVIPNNKTLKHIIFNSKNGYEQLQQSKTIGRN